MNITTQLRNGLLLTMLATACSGAFAAESADLSVKGVIRPSACSVALSNNGTVDYGTISAKSLSATDVTKLTGAERKVTATVSGDFRLHGRKAQKSAKIELNFKYEGDKLTAVEVKTLEPFVIPLEEFEVHPRDAAGKLVKTLTEAISSNLKGKVAKDAPVSVSFVAKAK